MIEAMATGTPVIAYGRGSVPEVVKDGETGFIVPPEKGVEGLIEAVKNYMQCPKRRKYARMRKIVENTWRIISQRTAWSQIMRNCTTFN